MDCPKCGEECVQIEVDIGVGIMYGPPHCDNCGWTPEKENDILKLKEDSP